MRRVLGGLFLSVFAFSLAYAAEAPSPGRSDVGDYERLLLMPRVERRGDADDASVSWRETALGHVVAWQEFTDRYPEAIFVPAPHTPMAGGVLTLKSRA